MPDDINWRRNAGMIVYFAIEGDRETPAGTHHGLVATMA